MLPSPLSMSLIELVAVLLGLANIVLIIRRSVWNFPFGIAMVAIYAIIFRDAQLYSDAGLQVFFLVVQIYGWWSWMDSSKRTGMIVVEQLSRQALLLTILSSCMITLLWGWLMDSKTDASHPYWDAAIAMLSVTAQILMTRRVVENWYYWIAVDILSIPLYIVKELYLTAGLYCMFLALAITGLLQWRSAGRAA